MNKYDVDEELLKELFMKIRIKEGQNLRSGKEDDKSMRRAIKNDIEKTVRKEAEQNEI